jgi:steroid 5-alpha reductase family enzyme
MSAIDQHAASSIGRSLALCALAYVAAGLVAVVVASRLAGHHPIVVAAIADVAATLVVWGFSTVFRNSSFYDPYWSAAPIAIAAYWVECATRQAAPSRQLLALLVVLLWALRLTYNWARRWQGLADEDWRYADFRSRYGARFWMIDLSGIHMFPTVQVFLGCLPLYPALATGTRPLGFVDLLALLLGIKAVAIETIADKQLWRFLQERKPGETLKTGLWAYSRHPNYFGEILFWWSLWLFALAADPSWWWSGIGALSITLMFRFASLPMIDKRNIERRPGYAEHMRRVSAIVPWFPKA